MKIISLCSIAAVFCTALAAQSVPAGWKVVKDDKLDARAVVTTIVLSAGPVK